MHLDSRQAKMTDNIWIVSRYVQWLRRWQTKIKTNSRPYWRQNDRDGSLCPKSWSIKQKCNYDTKIFEHWSFGISLDALQFQILLFTAATNIRIFLEMQDENYSKVYSLFKRIMQTILKLIFSLKCHLAIKIAFKTTYNVLTVVSTSGNSVRPA